MQHPGMLYVGGAMIVPFAVLPKNSKSIGPPPDETILVLSTLLPRISTVTDP